MKVVTNRLGGSDQSLPKIGGTKRFWKTYPADYPRNNQQRHDIGRHRNELPWNDFLDLGIRCYPCGKSIEKPENEAANKREQWI